MADVITQEERAAIDAAVRRGAVTRVPAGANTAPQYKFSAKDRKLVQVAGRDVSWGGANTASTKRIQKRRESVRKLVALGFSGPEIAAKLRVSSATVYADTKALKINIPRRSTSDGKPAPKDKASAKKELSAARKITKVKDRRRFKTGVPATGRIAKMVATSATGTLYPASVRPADGSESVLKGGANSAKIGGHVLVGYLKDAPIYTLTLEERATCPTSCQMWRGCYGNGMDKAHRFAHGPALIDQLRDELRAIQRAAPGKPFLVRLHVLGDFWSLEYASFWGDMLHQIPELHVFGFTAHSEETEIGTFMSLLRTTFPRRFWVRHSGRTGAWGSFTIDFPTEAKTIGDAVVCPAQLDANAGAPRKIHCGNCAVCWSTDRPVAFIQH